MMTTMAATRRMMTRLLVLMFDVALLALNDPGAEVQKSKEAKMKAAMAGGKSRKKTLGSLKPKTSQLAKLCIGSVF